MKKLLVFVLMLSSVALANWEDSLFAVGYNGSTRLPENCVKKGDKIKCAGELIKGSGWIYDLAKDVAYEYVPKFADTVEIFSKYTCHYISSLANSDLFDSIRTAPNDSAKAEMFKYAKQKVAEGSYYFTCYVNQEVKLVTCKDDGSYRLREYDEVGIVKVDKTGKTKGNSMCKDLFHKEYK